MKKLLITGAKGFLGNRAAHYYRNRYKVIAAGHDDVDITCPESVDALMATVCPDAVIHCAALSDTGWCERHPDRSEAINLQGTVNVARACAHTGCRLVYMSSDQVYAGTAIQGPLAEDLALQPTGVYGRHKLEAEKAVARIAPDAVGLRLTWMYDHPLSRFSPERGLLVLFRKAAFGHAPMRAATHECRGLTYVWHVVERLEACLQLPGGVYNFGCGNSHHSFDTYRMVAELRPDLWPELDIQPDEDRFKDCPRNLSMNLNKVRAFGIGFPETVEAFRLVLDKEKDGSPTGNRPSETSVTL